MKTLKLEINSTQNSLLGNLWAAGTDQGLRAFAFGINESQFKLMLLHRLSIPVFGRQVYQSKNNITISALEQVQEYLSGYRQQFSIPIDWRHFTDFQTRVYRAVISVPYGETRTYGQIAAQIGRPKTARAVGAANAANPLPIIIPCHRLVGADGSLLGYGGAGGIETKRWLQNFETENIK